MASQGLHRFAILTAGATLALVFVGGLVTSTGSGLAVPDWPLSYGRLFPRMVGGVLYEHGHRMVAATVGLLMTVLAIWIFLRERRRWVGRLAAAALFAIILQATLGGLTVLLLLPPAVSVAHACLAQAFLCLTVALAVVTGPTWRAMRTRRGSVPPGGSRLRALTGGLLAAIYGQLILGAIMRHTGAGLAIPDFPLSFGRLIPPLGSFPVAIHFAHRLGAVLIAVLVGVAAHRILRHHPAESLLVRPALLIIALVSVQITLGATVIWTGKAVLPTTSHVACGAGLLAASLVLALRAWAISGKEPARYRIGELVRGQVHGA
ncbi:MAG: heme A synthase [Acidobacteriota bacterium]